MMQLAETELLNSAPVITGERQNLLRNSLGIFICRILTTIAALVSIPLIVSRLGIAGYGTWESLFAVSVVCSVFQSSVSGTLLWLISNAYGSKDTESVRQYVRMGVCISAFLFLTITPISWFARHFLIRLFRVPAEFQTAAAWIFPLIVGLMLLGLVNEIMGALIGGYQRAALVVLIQTIATIANNLLVIACLAIGFGFWSLLIGFVAAFLISAVGLYISTLRVFGRLSFLPRLPSRAVLVKVTPYASFILLGTLSIVFRDQADKIVLSSVASPAWAGYYGIAARLAGIVAIVCTFLYVPTIAVSGALFAKNEWMGIRGIYDDVTTIMSFLAGLVIVIIAGLNDRIVFLWFGKLIPEVAGILYLLMFGIGMAVILTGAGSSVCKGIGRVRAETLYIIVGLILNILMKAILVPMIGAIGTVISSAVSWALASVIFLFLLHRFTELPPATSMKAVKTVFIVVACVLLARLIAFIVPVETKRTMVGLSAMSIGIFIALVFTIMMVLCKVIAKDKIMRFPQIIRMTIAGRKSLK